MLPVNDGQRSGKRKKPKIDEVESEKKSMQGIAYQRNKHVASKRKHSRKSEEKRNAIYCFCHDLETLIFRFQEPL